ncbi:MAG: hypothetical protein DRH32_02640 [Deltaproteobacteria bacterium]|nr:MAG: hypothetical protein DRH32_02640 [Deltaproteobacteria bacterium]
MFFVTKMSVMTSSQTSCISRQAKYDGFPSIKGFFGYLLCQATGLPLGMQNSMPGAASVLPGPAVCPTSVSLGKNRGFGLIFASSRYISKM